ncbi:amidohydrolase [Rummeliibacillus pycnus]|uniref:amidohydrolase n=1 Tax=Rummeliibacillus pycnus TaxID=101070 RepID=UPI003D284B2F
MNVLHQTKVNFQEIVKEVVAWRHYLHQHPELSFQEVNTSQFIYDKLSEFGNLEITRPTKTSVMARLIGSQPGKVLGIRADMDALPIQEQTGLEFASENPGVMHACGHDAHTAMLLGTVKILTTMQDQIKGEIRFFFQHAEETLPGGAKEMVAAGVMEGVDVVIGAHVMSDTPVGKIGIVYGPMMASPDGFNLKIQGFGGHGASPHQTVDSIAIAAQVITNLQHIVSRNIDPLESFVITVGKISGGVASNVIADSVELSATVRSFGGELRAKAKERIERVIKGVTEAHGATYELDYEYGYDPVITDHQITKVIEDSVRELYGDEAISIQGPRMGGEDFSAFLNEKPGTFFMIGSRNEEKGITYPHHHPKFDVDDDALQYGVNIFVNAAFKLLK